MQTVVTATAVIAAKIIYLLCDAYSNIMILNWLKIQLKLIFDMLIKHLRKPDRLTFLIMEFT